MNVDPINVKNKSTINNANIKTKNPEYNNFKCNV